MNRPMALTAIVAPILWLLGGCGPLAEPAPLDVVLMVDSSASAADGRTPWLSELKNGIKAGYLGNAARVAVVQITARPRLVWAGAARNRARLEQALRTAASPGQPGEGSDPTGGLEITERWLAGRSRRRSTRQLVLIWSDLVPDPCKKERTVLRTFRDPLTWRWTRAMPEVQVFGIEGWRADKLSRAWTHRERAVQAHQRGESLDLSQMGLEPRVF
jgi:hypothetical protein